MVYEFSFKIRWVKQRLYTNETVRWCQVPLEKQLIYCTLICVVVLFLEMEISLGQPHHVNSPLQMFFLGFLDKVYFDNPQSINDKDGFQLFANENEPLLYQNIIENFTKRHLHKQWETYRILPLNRNSQISALYCDQLIQYVQKCYLVNNDKQVHTGTSIIVSCIHCSEVLNIFYLVGTQTAVDQIDLEIVRLEKRKLTEPDIEYNFTVHCIIFWYI